MYVRLSLALTKSTARHAPRVHDTSNTGALRIHSDELKNSTDRLTESEVDPGSCFIYLFVCLNVYVKWSFVLSTTHAKLVDCDKVIG